jgi:hypothetical protein
VSGQRRARGAGTPAFPLADQNDGSFHAPLPSVLAEQTTAEVAKTAPRSSTVVEPEDGHRAKSKVIDVSVNRRSTPKPVSVTAAEVVTVLPPTAPAPARLPASSPRR